MSIPIDNIYSPSPENWEKDKAYAQRTANNFMIVVKFHAHSPFLQECNDKCQIFEPEKDA